MPKVKPKLKIALPKKRNLKKKVIRKKSRGFNPSAMTSSMSPIPDKFFTKLRYSVLTSISYTASSSPGVIQYRLNSLFAPFAAESHQPLGFDEFAELYRRYRVHGCKYTIIVNNRETAYQVETCMQIRPNTTQHTVMNTVFESPYTNKRILGVEGSGKAIGVFKGFIPITRASGVSKDRLKSDTDFQALITASPAEVPTLNIYMQNNTTNQNAEVALRVTLDYYSEFFERKILTAS